MSITSLEEMKSMTKEMETSYQVFKEVKYLIEKYDHRFSCWKRECETIRYWMREDLVFWEENIRDEVWRLSHLERKKKSWKNNFTRSIKQIVEGD